MSEFGFGWLLLCARHEHSVRVGVEAEYIKVLVNVLGNAENFRAICHLGGGLSFITKKYSMAPTELLCVPHQDSR